MNELTIRRKEAELALAREFLSGSREVAIAALKNPTISMVGGVALTEYLRRHHYIDDVETVLLTGALVTPSFMGAFTPLISGLARL